MFKKKKILIIAAHPDDETLGCGGFISKYSSNNIFRVIFIAEGESCRKNKKLKNNNFTKKILYRNKQSKKALKSLGVSDVKFYNKKCGCLNSLPLININKIIENEIETFSPSVILTHSQNDLNSDHTTISSSVNVAIRPVSKILKKIKLVLNFEIVSSSEWNLESLFKPNFFVKLNKIDLERKIKALKIYDKEIRKKPHSRSVYGIDALAKYRGLQIGEDFAESFKIYKLTC